MIFLTAATSLSIEAATVGSLASFRTRSWSLSRVKRERSAFKEAAEGPVLLILEGRPMLDEVSAGLFVCEREDMAGEIVILDFEKEILVTVKLCVQNEGPR